MLVQTCAVRHCDHPCAKLTVFSGGIWFRFCSPHERSFFTRRVCPDCRHRLLQPGEDLAAVAQEYRECDPLHGVGVGAVSLLGRIRIVRLKTGRRWQTDGA
jgi:hypothetical protein